MINYSIINMIESEYHAHPAYGSGSIKLLSKSPAAYYQSKKVPVEVNEAMDFGSAFHMRVLQPERYLKEVVELKTDVSFATKEGKALREQHPDALFLKPRQVVTMNAMLEGIDGICQTLGMNPLTEPGQSEIAHFWGDGDGETIQGKALIDRQCDKLQWLVDIKTTRSSLEEKSLLRYAADFGWAIQAAWYARGVRKTLSWENPMFVFMVFQTVPPFSVRLMPVPEETMEIGSRLVERALKNERILQMQLSGGQRPTDPDSGPFELKYPQWFLDNLNL